MTLLGRRKANASQSLKWVVDVTELDWIGLIGCPGGVSRVRSDCLGTALALALALDLNVSGMKHLTVCCYSVALIFHQNRSPHS